MTRLPIRSLALAAILALLGSSANAGFNYSSVVSPPITIVPGSSTSIVLLGSTASVTTQFTPTFINLFQVQATSTDTTSDSVLINFNDSVEITNVPPFGTVGSGTINITGSLNFTNISQGGNLSFLAVNSPSYSVTAGNVVYTISNFQYSAPTVNGSNGSVSGLVTSAAVPEPASMAMVGLGLSGVGLVARRRRLAK